MSDSEQVVVKDEMFVKAETPVKVKKERKKRIYTDEQKKAMVDRMKAGKAKKKAEREAAKAAKADEPVPKSIPHTKPEVIEKAPRVDTPFVDEAVTMEQLAGKTPIKTKAVKNTELDDLRKQLEDLKGVNLQNEKEIIKMNIQKEQEKRDKREAAKVKRQQDKEKVKALPKEKVAPVKRYSTYKKSIWAQFDSP